MRRSLAITLFVAILFATLNVGQVSTARAWGGGGCSLASVAGTFGFTYNGTAILPTGAVPVAAVGTFRSDASGKFVGSETNSLAGTTSYETIVGTLTVKPDCAGTLVAQVFQGGTLVRTSYIHIQYSNNAAELFGIFQKLVLPNNTTLPVVVTIDGKRVSNGE